MFVAEHISYSQANAFTRIVQDYIAGSEKVKPFYNAPPTLEGIKEILHQKKRQPINRKLLVEVLREQYQAVSMKEAVQRNIALLAKEETFTVCTAHQPNLFTGPLYFIYKIIHIIRLAASLKDQLPDYHFVPAYYMGSEDADFAELNHTYVDGKKIEWNKEQTGAVGRMLVDHTLIQLIDELEGQLGQEKYGLEVIALLRECYSLGKNIQTATLKLVNEIYGDYGLVVIIPDHAGFKGQMKSVFADDLFKNMPSQIVKQTSERIEIDYEVQAHSRDINLFYLYDNTRERIAFTNNKYHVLNTQRWFTEKEMHEELESHPERFSPNVILRGLYQETILPNLVFVGGGGELAYWLQLKQLFEHYKVVYPVLLLRNSFLIVEEKMMSNIKKTGRSVFDFFSNENTIIRKIIDHESVHKISLNGTLDPMNAIYEQISTQAGSIDPTLTNHVASIRAKTMKQLEELEKKMLRSEKRKYANQMVQVQKIRQVLFPGNGLQERVENFSSFYAKWGRNFIEELFENSLSLDQKFTILIEQ